MNWRRRWPLIAAWALLAGAATAQESPPVRVCLPQESAPYSFIEAGQERGFDLVVLKEAAARIGRSLRPVWFESAYDKEGNLSLEARALLAAGVCDLVAGVPLYEPQLAPMIAEKARTPDYPGAPPLRLRPWQTLVPVAGGAPYRASALALISREPQDAAVVALEALKDRSVAVRAGSMASLAVGGWHAGAIAASIRGYNVREDVLGAVAEGQADFALVDIALWDRYRAAHPQSALRRTPFDHAVKLNIGLLARQADEPLLHDMATALAAAQATGSMQAAATAAGATWVAPVAPTVRPVLTLRDFVSPGG